MKRKTLKRLTIASKILFHIFLILCSVMVVAQPILLSQADIINTMLGVNSGGGTVDADALYFDTKFKNGKIEDVHDASKDIIEETMAEGAVLLKNENKALPLDKGDAVNLYGAASYYSVHVGQGSGGCEDSALDDRITLEQGLTAAGLSVNQTLNNWYKSNGLSSLGGSNFIGGSSQASQYLVKDIAWDSVHESRNQEAVAGVLVLARNSGEATDLYMDVTMDDGATRVIDNQYKNQPSNSVGDALVLTANEKTLLEGMNELKTQKKLTSVIVLINCASPLECDFIDEYGVDACMWVGTLGTTGAYAVGKLLTGEYNPSGRASDTFWAKSMYNPVYYNFGTLEYGNSGVLASNYTSTQGKIGSKHYVVYQEGIYNGYKYTETRYEDKIMATGNPGDYDYSKVVSYPFGYGLSYTGFTYSNMQVTENQDDTYTVTVDVTNNTDVAGKEVVQIYLQKPYTDYDKANGIETASAELIGFTKVEVAGNATVQATVTVEEKYFAVYDGNEAKTYVIGSDNRNDEYLLTAAKDSHDAVNNFLQYKKDKGVTSFDDSALFVNAGRSKGDKALVWNKHIDFNATKYSTNAFIQEENKQAPAYEGAKVNYGVDKITNRFDDVDFRKSPIFTAAEREQKYTTRSDWAGTCGKRINLTANAALKTAQENPELKKDDVAYPTYGETGIYTENGAFDTMKLIYLKGADYNDPKWDMLLNQITQEEMCSFLQYGYRVTRAIPSVAAPDTSQQNGGLAPNHARNYSQLTPQGSGFTGFVNMYDSSNVGSRPPVFCCNGIVASTFNTELIERLGEQTGEEAAWAGYNGIYGLGVNIHRGAYCGRTFEYYSEDGFLTGVAAGYEAVGLHKLGVFVLMKHAVLNDQETNRAGINVWANEQSIREIYCRAIEVAVEIDREYTPNSVLGVMTGMNRMGAKWTGAQGFCNTVLRAEFGMRGFVVSDYNTSRLYMNPVYGVLGGNDLPDGDPASKNGAKDYDGRPSSFDAYTSGYGELAWAMRDSTHKVLYTVVNSNAMNGITSDTEIRVQTPAWQIALPVVTRVIITLFVWIALAFAVLWAVNLTVGIRAKKAQASDTEDNKQE